MMVRIVFGALLLGHGLVHLAWFAPLPPDDAFPFRWDSPMFPDVSPSTMRRVMTPAILLLVAAFTVAALGMWGVAGLSSVWSAAAILGALVSTVVMAVLWHPWFVTGPFVNLLILLFAFVPTLLA
jgi:hypothetical protein